jgi:hypothetical protein
MMGRRHSETYRPISERNKMPERKMRGGALTVLTRSIPGYASLQVALQFKQPDPPKVQVHSIAGHNELKDAPIDSPEWEEYARQAQEVEKRISQARSDFMYDYSVEAWSWNGGAEWDTDAPTGWVFPAVFLRHGIQPSDNRRVDYIRYDLITDNADVAVLFQDALGSTSPITDAEEKAASAGFRADDERRTDSRGKVKWYQRFQRVVQ